MMSFAYIAVGGALGAVLRHGVNLATMRAFGPGFPVGTIAVNIAGSLVMGLFVGWLARRSGVSLFGLSPDDLRLLIATGFLGAFTTFSAFSLDVAVLVERGAMTSAVLYVLASVFLSIAAVFLGLFIMRGV